VITQSCDFRAAREEFEAEIFQSPKSGSITILEDVSGSLGKFNSETYTIVSQMKLINVTCVVP